MSDGSPSPEPGRPAWRRHLRKWVALAVLLAGLGWVFSRHWDRPARHDARLQIRVEPEAFSPDGELLLILEDGASETAWSFRGRLREPIRDFEIRLVPGRYELRARWLLPSEKSFEVKASLTVPGTLTRIRIPGG